MIRVESALESALESVLDSVLLDSVLLDSVLEDCGFPERFCGAHLVGVGATLLGGGNSS